MKKFFKAVIFDMDGVILDSERYVQSCWKLVADRHGIPDIINTCMKCLGTNTQRTIEIFKEKYGENFPYDKYKAEMRELYYGEMYGDQIPLKAGAKELLTALKKNGVPVALASSTRKDAVEKELRDADVLEYFDVLVCGDMVKRSKPAPDIFLEACRRLGFRPHECYAVEDSFNGIRAACSGKLRAILVPDLAAPTDEIRAMAEAVLPSLTAVKDYLFEY